MSDEKDELTAQLLQAYLRRPKRDQARVGVGKPSEVDGPHLTLGTMLQLNDGRASEEERATALRHLSDCEVCRNQLARVARVAATSPAFWREMSFTEVEPPRPQVMLWAIRLRASGQAVHAGAWASGTEAGPTFPARYQSDDGSVRMAMDDVNGRLLLLVEKRGVAAEGEVVFVGVTHEVPDDEPDGVYVALAPSSGGWASGKVFVGDRADAPGMQISAPVAVEPEDTPVEHVRLVRDSMRNRVGGEAAWAAWQSRLPAEVRDVLTREIS